MQTKILETFNKEYFFQIQFHEEGLKLLLLVLKEGKGIKNYSAEVNFNDDSILSQMFTSSSFYELTKLTENYEVDPELGVFILKCKLTAVNFNQNTNLRFPMKIVELTGVEELQYEVLFYKKKLCQYNYQDEPIIYGENSKSEEKSLKIGKFEAKTLKEQKRVRSEETEEAKKDEHIFHKIIKSKKIRKERTFKKNEAENTNNEKITNNADFETTHIEDKRYKLKFYNGDVYEGEMLNQTYNGYGCYTSKHLGSYKGNWKDGKFEGKGISIDNDGNKYEGNFSNDMKNGKGKETFINGEVYEGEYENGVKCGFGIYYFITGERYEGEWKDDVFEGKGKFVKSDGSYEEGMWSNDEQVGSFIKVDREGKVLHLKKGSETGCYVKIEEKDIELVNEENKLLV